MKSWELTWTYLPLIKTEWHKTVKRRAVAHGIRYQSKALSSDVYLLNLFWFV